MAHRADGLNDIFEENVTIRKKLKTKTGEIESSPTTDQEIANKLYVDSQISGENHWDMDGTSSYIYPHVTGINVALNGGWLSGDGGDEGIFIDGVGKVGIGTTSPTSKLQVSKDVIANYLTTAQLLLTGSTNTNKTLSLGYDTTNDVGFIEAAISGTGYKPLLINPYGGNVGIGTTSPTSKLHIVGGTTSSDITLNSNDKIKFRGDGVISWGAAANQGMLTWDTGRVMMGGLKNNNLSLLANGLEKVRITTEGNVGIGTTSPNKKLTIATDTSDDGITLTNSTGGVRGTIAQASTTGGYLALYNNVSELTSLIRGYSISGVQAYFTAGNVGIGTTSPDSKLEVTGDVHIDGDLYFETDGTGLPYGEMYANNVTHTVDIVSADAFVEIDGDMTGGELNLETFPDDHYLQVTKAGRYLVNWSMSIYCASANQEIEGAVMVGGTAQTKGTAHGNMITANAPITISGTLILDLAASAQISLGVANHTGTTDVVMQHASLTAVMIGGT